MNSRGKEINQEKTSESHERHAKRRKMYSDMDAAEKNALLLQRRIKKREITTKRLRLDASFIDTIEPTSTLERNVVVRSSCSISKADMLSTGKNMFHPLSVFEKGSTSGTSNEPAASNLEILALNDDSRVILTTKNNFVDEINNMLIDQFPGKARIFVGIDETIEPDNQAQFEDLLHTLNPPGIYLREPVFSHGQLYVALSRAKNSNGVKLLIRPPTSTSNDDQSTNNIVYEEIIQKAIL